MVKMERNDFDIIDSEFDDRSGEELYAEFLGKIEKPKEEFVYYYGAYYNIMTQLTGAAMNLFTWMTFHCEVNSGRVVMQSFVQRQALKDMGITVSTYYKALGVLKEKGMIKGTNAIYFVNPSFAWKGTAEARMRFMKVYPKL